MKKEENILMADLMAWGKMLLLLCVFLGIPAFWMYHKDYILSEDIMSKEELSNLGFKQHSDSVFFYREQREECLVKKKITVVDGVIQDAEIDIYFDDFAVETRYLATPVKEGLVTKYQAWRSFSHDAKKFSNWYNVQYLSSDDMDQPKKNFNALKKAEEVLIRNTTYKTLERIGDL